MKETHLISDSAGARARVMRRLLIFPLAALAAGCIQVKAPEKPIEINLNVNVRQEVLVRLQRDAQTLIEENPELFPQ